MQGKLTSQIQIGIRVKKGFKSPRERKKVSEKNNKPFVNLEAHKRFIALMKK